MDTEQLRTRPREMGAWLQTVTEKREDGDWVGVDVLVLWKVVLVDPDVWNDDVRGDAIFTPYLWMRLAQETWGRAGRGERRRLQLFGLKLNERGEALWREVCEAGGEFDMHASVATGDRIIGRVKERRESRGIAVTSGREL